MVFEENKELYRETTELLAKLRKIVGRGFNFSEAYLKQCNYDCNRIGEQEIRYGKITKQYVYIGCRAIYTTNDEGTEYGARIRKYSVCTRQGETNKIALEDLFVCDLEKILHDIEFALWWEKGHRLKYLEAEMADCQKYVALFNKFLKK